MINIKSGLPGFKFSKMIRQLGNSRRQSFFMSFHVYNSERKKFIFL